MEKRQRTIISVVIILMIVSTAILTYWIFYGRYFQSTDDAYIKGDITNISSRVNGIVTAIDVQDNAFVKSGTPLIALDDRDFKNMENQAKGNLEEKNAQLKILQAKKRVNDDNTVEAKAKIDQAKARLIKNQQEQHRIAELIKHNYASHALLDSANTDVRFGKAAVVAAEAACKSLESQSSLIDAEMQQTEASIDIAQLQIKQKTLNLSYTRINAPVDGIITNRNITTGMYIAAGMPLFSLVSVNKIWIEANFKETQLSHLKLGQPVSVSIDAYPDEKIKGEIDSIMPGSGSEFALLPPNNATGNFTKIVQRLSVKIIILDLNKLKKPLYPGLSVEVSVDTR